MIERLQHIFDSGLRAEGGLPPEFAYHLEGQAIAVHEAQVSGRLLERKILFEGVESKIEMGLEWYVVNYDQPGGMRLFSRDCNRDTIEKLRDKDLLTEISDTLSSPEVFNGRNCRAIAALLLEDQVLYKSPGFDLEAYRASKHNKDKVIKNSSTVQSEDNTSIIRKLTKIERRERRRMFRRMNRQKRKVK